MLLHCSSNLLLYHTESDVEIGETVTIIFFHKVPPTKCFVKPFFSPMFMAVVLSIFESSHLIHARGEGFILLP